MVLKIMMVVAGSAVAVPALAQDIVPIISPGQAAESVFQRSRAGGDSRRERDKDVADPAPQASAQASARADSGSPGLQKQTCDNLPAYRKQYGDDHPQILKLEGMCKDAGY